MIVVDELSRDYPVRTLCRVLKCPRASYYRYKAGKGGAKAKDGLTDAVIEVFNDSNGNYGSRRIKAELSHRGIVASRRRIRRIMKENFLFSSYQIAYFKPCCKKPAVNRDGVGDVIAREFSGRAYREVAISDLTYIKVGSRTAYICFITDLFNREIIGYSAGFSKTPELVLKAFASIKDLGSVKYFHTDRGSEFKNGEIDELLLSIGIKRSLSDPGCPLDNACAESLFGKTKVEFVRGRAFDSMDQVRHELFKHVMWYNHTRLHSSLGYLSPVAYKAMKLGLQI